MAPGDLLCPLDGTILGLPNWTYRGGPPHLDSIAPGEHAHVFFIGTFTCSNGHRWQAKEGSDLVMERIQ
jgi:hypothetical protein